MDTLDQRTKQNSLLTDKHQQRTNKNLLKQEIKVYWHVHLRRGQSETVYRQILFIREQKRSIKGHILGKERDTNLLGDIF